MAETLRKDELQVKHFLKADAFGEVITVCKSGNDSSEIIYLVEDTEDFFLHIYENATGNIMVNGNEIDKTLDRWISEDNIIVNALNCKLIFIEGYAGCGKSTLVQYILYKLLKNKNYEYSYYNYDIGSYQDDYNVVKNDNNETDFIKYSIICSLKKQIIKLLDSYDFKKIYEEFSSLMNDENLLGILESTCKIKAEFGNTRVFKKGIQLVLESKRIEKEDYIKDLENIIEIQLQDFNVYQLLCIDYLWRLAQYCANPREYLKYMYVCYDNLDSITNFEILSNFKEQLITFRNNLNNYILAINRQIAKSDRQIWENIEKIPPFIIFSTYRKITAVRSNSYNHEMLNDRIINYNDIKVIEVSRQYDFNKIAKKRIKHFSQKLQFLNIKHDRKSKLINQMNLINQLKEMSFVKSKYARLWNNNFRSCSNVLSELIEHNYIDAQKCIELFNAQIDGYNHEKYCYYGASALFLHAVCRLLKNIGIFNEYHLDVINEKSDPRQTCLSRLILTYIKNKNESVSIVELFEKFELVFEPKEICRIIGQLLTRVNGEIWRRPIYYSKNALNNELNIENVLYEQYKKYKDRENYSYVEFKICDCGETYINDIVPHFEFYSIRINPKNKALYCIEDDTVLKQILKDIYERIEECCKKQYDFLNCYIQKYQMNNEGYMLAGFHPTTRSGNSQLHIERVIFAHIDYINKYRMYLNSMQHPEKYDDLNDIVLFYIEKYINLYKKYVSPISNYRNKIVEIMEGKLNSQDKYISIEVSQTY